MEAVSPEPYYSDNMVTLYHGDCREITEWVTADVLVTDPPYGRGWKQGETRHGNRRRQSDAHTGIANDQDTQTRDAALELWGDRPVIAFGDLMLPPPSRTKQVMIYRKAIDAGGHGATAGRRRDVEAIYLIGPWPSGLGGDTSVIASGASLQGGSHGLTGRYRHPHAKPLDVMEELIGLCPPGVVADPFAGSGSTLLAAKLQGHHAVGVELDERYCEIAARRLSQESLFGGAA